MRTETAPPIQSVLMELYQQLGIELGHRYDICRAHAGDPEAREKHAGHGLHEHSAERLCEAILALLKAHTP